jgi:carbonic anhydrase
MKLVIFLAFNVMVIGGVFSLMAQDATPVTAPHWEYEGEEGPEHWGEIGPEYALCGDGHAQSPIDITGAGATNLADITFHYNPSALNIFNNGHTIQVNYDAGSSITYNEIDYQLLQFHFHTPSEHTIDGEAAEMEVHFVHRNEAGNLAVVGVMMNVGDEANAPLASVFDHLPAEKGDPQANEWTVNASDVLPAAHLYDTYTGSLTTPPCSQGVRWLVLTEPITISEAQFEAFKAIFEMNARPVQPLNHRDLLVDTAADS